MGKMEGTIKSEILRLAKREVRAAFLPLRREVWTIRLKLSGLSKGLATLTRQAKELRRGEARPKLEASPEEVKASRLTPERIRNLRMKKGISQRELARRMGRPLNAINEIINGKKSITADTALQLEEVMPEIPARFWLNMETDYQLTRALINKRAKVA